MHARLMRTAIWLACLAASFAPMLADAEQPDRDVRDRIETFLEPGLLFPETADWRYLFSKPYLNGTLWCGQVNLMNSAKIYMGFHPFYATVFSGAVHEATILGGRRDDPTGAVGTQFRRLCNF